MGSVGADVGSAGVTGLSVGCGVGLGVGAEVVGEAVVGVPVVGG